MQTIITLVGFVALLLAVYREARTLQIVSDHSEISETPVGAIINAPRIAIVANAGRLVNFLTPFFQKKPNDVQRIAAASEDTEELYHRHFIPILGISILVLINAAYIWKYTKDTANYIVSLFDGVDAIGVTLGYGALVQYIGFVIVALTVSEIIDSGVKKEKPDNVLFQGKRVLLLDDELPRFLPEGENVMSNDETVTLPDGSIVALSDFRNPPDEIYSEENHRAANEIAKDRDAAKAYLMKNGFINENGELTKRYVSE